MYKDNLWDALASCVADSIRIGTRQIEGQELYTEKEAVIFTFNMLKKYFVKYGLVEDVSFPVPNKRSTNV